MAAQIFSRPLLAAFFATFAIFAAVGLVMFLARAPFHIVETWLKVAYPVTWAVIWFYLWRREKARSKR